MVSLGVLVTDGVMVIAAAVAGIAVVDGMTVAVADGMTVAVADGMTVAVADGMVVAVGDGMAVAVADGMTVAVALSNPIDGGPLMMNVEPSGMRNMLSVLFMAPKSMRST